LVEQQLETFGDKVSSVYYCGQILLWPNFELIFESICYFLAVLLMKNEAE